MMSCIGLHKFEGAIWRFSRTRAFVKILLSQIFAIIFSLQDIALNYIRTIWELQFKDYTIFYKTFKKTCLVSIFFIPLVIFWSTLDMHDTTTQNFRINLLLQWIFIYFLTHFIPLISFDTPWKYQKTRGFSDVLGGSKRDQWYEVIKYKKIVCIAQLILQILLIHDFEAL